MRSPAINDKVTANLAIGIATDVNDKIAFYHKTSTEDGDQLIFTLNGQEMETWSGIGDWERSEYELPAGNNLIRFSFKKDNSGSAGEDAVMIDQLQFPPFAKMVLYAGDDAETCPNAAFTPNGYIYNQTDFVWSTNGDGSFDDATLEHPIYTFGEADKAIGQVELTLTGTSVFNGSQQSSTLAVSLLPSFDPNHIPEAPAGMSEIDLRLVGQSEYAGEEIDDALYTWSLEPESAGILTYDGRQAFVEWNGEYRGQANISYFYENTCGATAVSNTLEVNVFNSTGINEQNTSTFEIYPNPTDGKVNLVVGENLQGKAIVEVFNILGERMLYQEASQLRQGETISLDLSRMVSGLYIIKLSAESGSCSKKVSVK